MCFQEKLFAELEEIPPFDTKVGNSSNENENEKGTVTVKTFVNGKSVTRKHQNILFVPTLTYDLLSVTVIARAALKTVFDSSSYSVYRNDKCIAQGTLRDMHYYLNTTCDATHKTMHVVLMANINQ